MTGPSINTTAPHKADYPCPWRKRVQIEGATLYLGDCARVIPFLSGVDAVVTDPPYGIGEAAGKGTSRVRLAKPVDYGSKNWDDRRVSSGVMSTVLDLAPLQVIFGGNYYDLPPTSCWLVWDKINGASDFADCELAWTNLKKAVRKIQWQWNGFIRQGEMDKTIDQSRVHPTQKPVEVMRWCLSHVPDAKTICDPFMGSGTTGVACARDGRKFIGIEQDPEYFAIACRRIREAYDQPDMFVEQP